MKSDAACISFFINCENEVDFDRDGFYKIKGHKLYLIFQIKINR